MYMISPLIILVYPHMSLVCQCREMTVNFQYNYRHTMAIKIFFIPIQMDLDFLK